MLVYAHIHSELWFIAFFALVPFLSQLCRSSKRDAPATGMMLATIYILATSSGDLLFAPKTFLFKLFALNVAFILFSLAINWVRRLVGFDPVFIALLWFPMEYLLIQYAHLNNIFSISYAGPDLMIGFTSLFGILVGSLVIVLGNSLLLLFVRYFVQWLSSHEKAVTGSDREYYPLSGKVTLETAWYSFPQPRSPP